MMHSADSLYDALKGQLNEVNKQIEAVTEDVERQMEHLPAGHGVTVYDWKHVNGQPVLEQLITAKAQLLSAMGALKAADMQSKAVSRKR